MPDKQYNVGDDILDLKLGDVLVWYNPDATHNCTVTGCQPALERDTYHIKAGKKERANTHKKSKQKYHYDCSELKAVGDGKLIVS